MAFTLRSVHMRYSQAINSKFGWSGHLWQGRYFSTALDDTHLWAAVRYVEQNPVRASIIAKPGDYAWSSAAHHLGLKKDKLISGEGAWAGIVEGWDTALQEAEDETSVGLVRSRTHSGYPCGDEEFIHTLSDKLGRVLIDRPRGRPRKQ